MIATSPTADPTSLARALLSAAAEVEAAEARIRQVLLQAARAGDTARLITILERWECMPACEVLAEIPLDSCGSSEVGLERRAATPAPGA